MKVPTRLTWMTRLNFSAGQGPSRPTARPAVAIPGAVHDQRQAVHGIARLRHGAAGTGFVRDVAAHVGGTRAECAGAFGALGIVDVEQCDLAARIDDPASACETEA